MTPIQQLFLGVGASEKTYMEDVFSTFLYAGNESNRSINNGIDLSGEGGMTWLKERTGTADNQLFDTERGAGKRLFSNSILTQATDATTLSAFNNNGFSLGHDEAINDIGDDYSSWTFRKAPGFFDVVTWTGNDTAGRTINHSLGSVPGMIIIKCTSHTFGWYVFHKQFNGGVDPATKFLRLDDVGAEATSNGLNDAAPTDTSFTVGANAYTNSDGEDYVAYIFAGAESTAATARSVDFDGTNDLLSIDYSSDLYVDTNWTAEGWFKCDALSGSYDFIFGNYQDGSDWGFVYESASDPILKFYYNASDWKSLGAPSLGQWHHIAVSKSGSDTRVFLNGTQIGPAWDIGSRTANTKFTVGGYRNNVGNVVRPFNGKVSNIRVVKGTTLYTSSFKPPTEPLTNITNTKLLICNNSSTTGSTVTPGTITAIGSPTASTDSPFDDPAAFTFGDAGDQNIIKCGGWTGNGSTTGPEINLGWEPQWILIRNTDLTTEPWMILDSMRGIPNGGNDLYQEVNRNVVEDTGGTFLNLTPTGFKLTHGDDKFNGDGHTYIYMAIRRPDGYAGKPAKLGTDVFNVVNQATDGVAPFYRNIGFPVDFALFKKINDSSHNWGASPRLTQGYYLSTNQARAESANSAQQFDYMDAWNDGTETSGDYMSWAWKRHAGFTVSTWTGNAVGGRSIPHDLNKIPEMIWVKNRDQSVDWAVYHKGQNSGSDPEDYFLVLNKNDAEINSNQFWHDTAPTSTHFTVGTNFGVNDNAQEMIAMLFSSVSGISKVGSYTGTGSGTSGHAITLGFSPRLLILKRVDGPSNWLTLDTQRGLGTSGNENYLLLSTDGAQVSVDWVNTTSTGFNLVASGNHFNDSGSEFIYYAHA